MQLTRCPICHSRIHLEALCQDEAGRELMASLAQLDTSTAAALVAYIGLFRPPTRDLANDRALRLLRQVEELGGGVITPHLAEAMTETVEAMRKKQVEGTFKPLTNHRYLASVFESVSSLPVDTTPTVRQTGIQSPAKPASKTAQAMQALMEDDHG